MKKLLVGKPQPKVKLKSISFYKKKAWTEFSKFIRARDNHICYTCGSEGRFAGHFISRQYNNTLYDEMNVHAQCWLCNSIKAGNIGAYTENLIRDYGVEALQELLKRGKETKQFTRPELQAIYGKYKGLVEALKEGT